MTGSARCASPTPAWPAALVAMLAALPACGGGGSPAVEGAAPPVEVGAGDWVVRVRPEPVEVALLRGDDVLLRFPADGLRLGAVVAVDDTVNYDPYRFFVPHPLYTPPDVTWLDVRAAAVVESDGPSAVVELEYDGTRAKLRIEEAAPGRFALSLVPEPGGRPIAYVSLRPRAGADEGFYGLGEVFDHPNHRGKVRAMQLEVDPTLESTNNEAHVPVPLLVGTRGWGLFVESPRPGVFAVATEQPDLVEASFGTGVATASEGLSFHLFGAAHPLDVTKLYYDVTGYPRLPAPWALGPWVWRDEVEGQAQVESDIEAIRDLDLATTAYWIDRPYATGVNTFDFAGADYPDPAAMIAKMHALGLRTALWHTPYLDESDPSTEALRKEAESKGYYPPQPGEILLNKWGRPIDLTNPGALAWWQSLIRKYTDMGVEGFKLDYGEDVVPGLTATRSIWRFHDGSDERTMHARFQLFYHRAYAEMLPDEAFLLCRGSTYGDQVNVSVIWPGDLDASFARHGEKVEEGGDSYTAVGGLPASLVAALSLGPSGFPFYGSDTGGYRHSPPDKELFTRWFQQTALSAVMQIGTSTNDVAWELGKENGFDEEMLGWYREYTRLHLRLFPYLWTYAKRLADDGRPILRALGLAHPELGEHPPDEYLVGDHLLVAPVVERGVTKREAFLPPGTWLDWFTGEAHEGPGPVTIDAPLEKLPLLLAAGGIVPMLRPTIDAIAPTTDPERVDSYATERGPLYIRIAPGPAATFRLFDGGEVGHEPAAEGGMVLRAKPGDELDGGWVFEVIAFGAPPASVVEAGGAPVAELASASELDAAASGWTYVQGAGGTLLVKLAEGERTVTVTR